MKLRNKIIMLVAALFLVFGTVSCGTKPGVLAYANYIDVITVAAAQDGQDASNKDEVEILLGSADDGDYDITTGDGYLEWFGEDGEYVKVTFVDTYATEITPLEETGLYESVYTTPIGAKTGVWNWIILQLGYFTFYASNLFGLLGNTYLYWLGLLIMTLVIRTIGWPIYAKTHDMSLKMQLAQPELSKIQEKYKGRQDQASQQRLQMETMDIYKKYKINLFGCLMPLLQMPIFIAMYQVVQRFPLTDLSTFTDKAVNMNTNFLWTTLGNTDWLPNLPLAILVAVLMFLSQWLSTHRTKTQQRPNQYQNAQAQQSQKTMKYMMYFMVIFMGYISLRNAGIAFYWTIGTAYQLLQSYISFRNMKNRQDQLRKQF